VDRLEHRRGPAGRVEVAAGGEPHAALHGRAEVGDDVAEEVLGDDTSNRSGWVTRYRHIASTWT
jgi:hypothetical protein